MAVLTQICPHFGVCGGCTRQNQTYAEQLAFKEDRVRDELKSYAVNVFHPIAPSPEIDFYRNKMEFSFGDLRDVQVLTTPREKRKGVRFESPTENNIIHAGLHPKKSFGLVAPTPECQLLSREAQKIMAMVTGWATEHQIPVYNRKKHSGRLRHLVIREGKNTGERLVNFVITSDTPHLEELENTLRTSQIPITTLMWTHHDGLSDVARGEKADVRWGQGFIEEKIGTLRQKISPYTFAQTNTHAFESCLILIQSWLTGHQDGELYDLYCGSGAIGLNLADQFRGIVGIESEKSSVEAAESNAIQNGIKNAVFYVGQAEKLTEIFEGKRENDKDVLIVDPPRNGLHQNVVKSILSSEFRTFIYVSCNPASLARDLQALTAKYTIEEVQPFDFFPHTDHVETVVRLTMSSFPRKWESSRSLLLNNVTTGSPLSRG